MHKVSNPINPNFGRGCIRAEFKEGPYTVVMRQMTGWRRFTCAVADAEILRQASCPGREELDNAVLRAFEAGVINKRTLRALTGGRS